MRSPNRKAAKDGDIDALQFGSKVGLDSDPDEFDGRQHRRAQHVARSPVDERARCCSTESGKLKPRYGGAALQR